jgi:hypothetical protein
MNKLALFLSLALSAPVLAQEAPPDGGLLQGAPRANMACGERTGVVQRLKEKYGETRERAGSLGDAYIEVYSNQKKGTFTILLSRPDGMSCLMAAGENWVSYEEPPGDPL